jgi:hypothetical protein
MVVFSQVADSFTRHGNMNHWGLPVNMLRESERVAMLIRLPNSIGIGPATANVDLLSADDRLVSKPGKMSERGSTGQIVLFKIKVS